MILRPTLADLLVIKCNLGRLYPGIRTSGLKNPGISPEFSCLLPQCISRDSPLLSTTSNPITTQHQGTTMCPAEPTPCELNPSPQI